MSNHGSFCAKHGFFFPDETCPECAVAPLERAPEPPTLDRPAKENERLRAALLNIQAVAERGFPIDRSTLAAQCRAALAR